MKIIETEIGLLADVFYLGRKVGFISKEKDHYHIQLNYKDFRILKKYYDKKKMYSFVKWHVESFEYRIQSEQNAISRGFKILL